MSLKLSKSLVKQGLALSVTALMMTAANAASSDKAEIQQLREEVAQLKSLIQQQQQVQQRQQVQLQEVQTQAAAPAPAQAPTLSGLLSKSGASVNIYGFVRADAEYAFKGADGIFNAPNKVDLNGVPVNGVVNPNKDRFYATAKTTRLGLDFKTPVQGADVGGKIEVDFAGSNDGLRIRHAYLTYNNWLFGQTTSSFLSTDTQPEMIDFGSPLGVGTKRTPMVRYADKINANTAYAVGLEQGRSDNRFPSATGKISYKLPDGLGLVNARALLQETRGRLVEAGKEYNDKTDLGWGVGLGTNIKLLKDQLILNADYSHVKGDDFYLLFSENAATLNTAKKDYDLNEFDAVTVGLTYKLNPKWRSTLGYGAIFYDDAKAGQNDKIQQGWLNVLYNPVKPITLGAEYVYGERDADIRTGRDSRLGVMAKYDF
ncbi:DcaP family trimeric outer membrane transporter [Acinetobacter gerneri]|uniref:DcaP family trimeric outer membrane transporter n=1 Tax=Acinetobacter gerneri TaxID=202952 RepID=A0AAW8JFV3_9GAMM|nr:DcaP family trimeric outer membrane transporter [Acinetobacter gerneri]MDQ9009668.1 DcaP family trimeric outer membrane transporter [Acinetobacter gerneri]MDQ9013640.1 DcaP family trimeric outer membrane transporter [Acinetobacter gerneri]MDQ9025054.1 DcaP family trimeric outer membrane transporter [Acinetobacter gerneri]MDQ9050817.1 DcaP family trimeric outer membrane transporter [Acinetobacter gerneri]MDQ9059831.1 DcaP family trimeric outer membrane transporter [Acinetobacter gerneri]